MSNALSRQTSMRRAPLGTSKSLPLIVTLITSVDIVTFALEPVIVHLRQEIVGNGVARSRTDYGIDATFGAKGCSSNSFIILVNPLCYLCRAVNFKTMETAAYITRTQFSSMTRRVLVSTDVTRFRRHRCYVVFASMPRLKTGNRPSRFRISNFGPDAS